MNIPNINNIVNNKYFSQKRIHSQTTIKEDRESDPSQSKDHPPTNFMNGEKLNPPSISSDGESLRPRDHKQLNDNANTHPPTDSVRKEDLTNNPPITKPRDHSPIKSIAGPSSSKPSNYLDKLNGQMGAIPEENNKQERTDCKNETPGSDETQED